MTSRLTRRKRAASAIGIDHRFTTTTTLLTLLASLAPPTHALTADVEGQAQSPQLTLADAPYHQPLEKLTRSGPLAIAATCLCNWTFPPNLDGSVLLLPDGACAPDDAAAESSCGIEDAVCAAHAANATGIIFSCAFNTSNFTTAYTSPADCFVLPKAGESPRDCGPPGGPLAAFVLPNASATLVAAAGAEASSGAAEQAALIPTTLGVNVTFSSDGVECSNLEGTAEVFYSVVPLWWILTAAWAWNTYRRNAESATDLHRLLTWIPVLQAVSGVLTILYDELCPWSSAGSMLSAMLYAVVSIIKEPVILMCLLLIAKGWCITRDTLKRNEVCVSGTVVALLYAVIAIHMSAQTIYSLIPFVVMYLAVLADIVLSIYHNLKVLKAQLLVLHRIGIDPTTTPVFRKYYMYVNLSRFTTLYVCLEAGIHISFSGIYEYQLWTFVLLHQIMELVVTAGIGYVFRARPLTANFRQLQEVASTLAEELMPSITTIEVKAEDMRGNNLIAWRSDLDVSTLMPQEPTTLVVLNPGEELFDPEEPNDKVVDVERPSADRPPSEHSSQPPLPTGEQGVEMLEFRRPPLDAGDKQFGS